MCSFPESRIPNLIRGFGGRRPDVIQRTDDSLATKSGHMGVYHGGGHVGMTEELLHSPDVRAVDQEVRGKRMTKGMASHPLCQSSAFCRLSDCFLNHRLMDMVTP
jgi:hypothetical protein